MAYEPNVMQQATARLLRCREIRERKRYDLEQELYRDYAPPAFDCGDAITYEWNESREKNLYGHFNFYFGIVREMISKSSLTVYLVLLFVVSLLGNVLWELLAPLLGM